MLRFIQRKLAIRSYRNRLHPLLERLHGQRAYYSQQQVESGVRQLALSNEHILYAYAMFSTRDEFYAHSACSEGLWNYHAMRAEAAGVPSSYSFESHDAGRSPCAQAPGEPGFGSHDSSLVSGFGSSDSSDCSPGSSFSGDAGGSCGSGGGGSD